MHAKRAYAEPAAAIFVAAVAAAGCGPMMINSLASNEPSAAELIPNNAASGGQTLEELETGFATLEGLAVSRFSISDRPNIKGNTGASISIQVDDGYELVEGSGLVDFLMASVWSVRDAYMPNANVQISMTASEGSDFDIVAAAHEAGWTDRPASLSPLGESETGGVYSHVTVVVSEEKGAQNFERLGPWPGDAPDVPAPFTARVDSDQGAAS